MRVGLICVFGFLVSFRIASAHGLPKETGADVEIRGFGNNSQIVYIGINPFLEHKGVFIDSATVRSGIAKFHFTPNPHAGYEIRLGQALLATDLGFSQADSIVYIFDSARSQLMLAYDRIGAFVYQEELDHDSKFLHYETNALSFRDTSCSAFPLYRDSVIQSLNYSKMMADTFAARFPEHAYFVWRNEQEVKDYYDLAIAYYFWEYEGVQKTQGCANFDRHWIDTVQLRSNYPPDLRAFTQYALGVRTSRWFATRNDTFSLRNKEQYEDRISGALQWSGLARDVALYEVAGAINWLAGRYIPLPYGIRLLKQVVDTLTSLRGDPRITELVQARLATLESHIAGAVAENFTLPDTLGILHSLKDYRGKAILLHFWASSCGPCVQTLPATMAFEKSCQNDTNLRCINIACEEISFYQWNTFVHTSGLTGTELYYHVGAKQISDTRPFGFQWVQWTPTYIVLDRHGRLISADDNPPPNKQLDEDILKAESD